MIALEVRAGVVRGTPRDLAHEKEVHPQLMYGVFHHAPRMTALPEIYLEYLKHGDEHDLQRYLKG